MNFNTIYYNYLHELVEIIISLIIFAQSNSHEYTEC